MGEVDDVTTSASSTRSTSSRRADGRRTPMVFRRPRDRDQDPRADRPDACRRAAGGGDPRAAARGRRPAGRDAPGSSTPSRRPTSATTGACRRSSATAHLPFPATICASVNDEVVHGIPGERALAEGDVISIDCGAIVEGWHGDAAITVPDRRGRRRRRRAAAGDRGVAVARHGRRPPRRPGHRHQPRRRDLRPRPRAATASSRTTPATASAPRCTWPPNVPNYGRRGRGPAIVEGLALAVEPMVTLGSKHTDLLEDEWTVATVDGSDGRALRAHVHPDPAGRLGAHGRRRRPGPPRRARRPIRRTLRRRFRARRRRSWKTGGAGGEYSPVSGVVSTASARACARCHWFAASRRERKRPPASARVRGTPDLNLYLKEQQRGRPHLGLDRHRRRHDRDLHLRPGHRRPPAARAEHEGVRDLPLASTSGWPCSSASVSGTPPEAPHGAGVLLRLVGGVLALHRQPLHLHHHHGQVRRAAGAPAVRPDDRHRDGADHARDLHRRRRGGDRATSAGSSTSSACS